MDLSIIIVNYNTTLWVRDLLLSIPEACSGVSWETIIIDNASLDFNSSVWEKTSPFRLITNQRNLGFGAACNQGMRVAQGNFIALVNPDMVLHTQTLSRLIGYLQRHPTVGAVGPQLLDGTGRIQPSCRRLPSLSGVLMESLGLARVFSKNRYFGRYHMSDWAHDTERDVEQIMGACLVTRTSLMVSLGFFDEQFFMYFEEVDLCKRILEREQRIVFYPEAKAVHHQGQAALTDKSNALIQFYKSRRLFFLKHHGWLSAGIVTLISMADTGLRSLFWFWQSRYRRGDAVATIMASSYWKATLAFWRPVSGRRS